MGEGQTLTMTGGGKARVMRGHLGRFLNKAQEERRGQLGNETPERRDGTCKSPVGPTDNVPDGGASYRGQGGGQLPISKLTAKVM